MQRQTKVRVMAAALTCSAAAAGVAGIREVTATHRSSGDGAAHARSATAMPTAPSGGGPGASSSQAVSLNTTPPGSGAGGGSSSKTYTPTGASKHASGTTVVTGRTISAAASDQSVVLVTGGTLTLKSSELSSTGSSKSSDESSFYGLDAGVLAEGSGTVNLVDGSVHTSGAGANALFAYGSSAKATASGTTLTATGQYAHGAMASGGGTVTIRNVKISTAGDSSAAVATDRGGGTITVDGGTMKTSGGKAPGIYSTGAITATDASFTATGSEAAVVEGANSITVNDCRLIGSVDRGVMLYQSMSGDAAEGTGRFTMRGGSLTARSGPAFYITNERAVISLSGGAKVTARSGVLVRSDSAGTGSGNTGAGITRLTASHEELSGNLIAAGTGSLIAVLSHSTLRGTITNASLNLRGTSVWTVTGNSTLLALSGLRFSGRTIENIVGDGHTVTYVAADNTALDGKTYRLADGGTLKPA